MKETTKQKVLRAYQVHKSIRKVSTLTGLSYGSVQKILKDRKALLPWDGFKRVKRWRGGNRGPVARWIERHPSVVLPTSSKEIARITSCPIKDAQSWKVARWKRLKRVVEKVVPKKIIRTWRYGKLEVELVDGTILTAEEVFEMERKMEEKK